MCKGNVKAGALYTACPKCKRAIVDKCPTGCHTGTNNPPTAFNYCPRCGWAIEEE